MGHQRQRRALFRVDASELIGTGHAMRCRTLASELERRRIEPWFASRGDAGAAGDQIVPVRSRSIRLDGPASNEVIRISDSAPREGRRRPFMALVLDHYRLGADWLKQAQRLATRRLVIDDLADRSLPCEILINANLGINATDYAGLVTPTTRLLLGVRFALLRPSFRLARAGGRRPAGAVRNVLVSMGGSDPADATDMAVSAVRLALPTARIDVVLGSLYHGGTSGAPRVNIHRGIGDESMAQLMMEADIAIGAGGTTSWERCALGLPAVILRLAPNQDQVASNLDAAGVAVDAGPAGQVSVATLAALVRKLSSDQSGRDAMGERAWDLVDGRGVERVAHHIDGVRIRRATVADARLLWGWANDPDSRSWSFNPEPIPYAAHVRWLRDRLADPSCLLVVGENGVGPLGQVRFDSRGTDAEVSISVAPEHRGTVGGLLLESALRRFRRRSPLVTLAARVKVDNEASRRLFEHAGFRLISERRGVLMYHASRVADTTP